jgi:hypothetical protein
MIHAVANPALIRSYLGGATSQHIGRVLTVCEEILDLCPQVVVFDVFAFGMYVEPRG